jgi:DNA polymerase-1
MRHAVLIDGPSIFHIAYHSRPPFEHNGQPIGALKGYVDFLWRLFTDDRLCSDADYAAVAFEGGHSFRASLCPAYKAHRVAHPVALTSQVRLIKEATWALGIATVEQRGYEADDMIGTYARLCELEGGAERITIVSRDKDLMQLVNARTSLFDPVTYKFQNPQDVVAKFGVLPRDLVDLFALMGDPVDGVEGVPGIGPKKAAKLLSQFGTLDRLLANTHLIEPHGARDRVISSIEAVRLARELVTIERRVDPPVAVADLAIAWDLQRFARYLETWGVIGLAQAVTWKAKQEANERVGMS